MVGGLGCVGKMKALLAAKRSPVRWGSQMCHLRAGLKLFLKNAGGKKIKNIGSAMSVGLLVVRL